jgi:hypothetical protein
MSARIVFKINRPGHCIDQTGYEYKLPAQLAYLNRGDKISLPSEHAPVGDEIRSNDIFVESGQYSESERKGFESTGPESKGSWEHRIGSSDYSTGTPWRHPNDPRFKVNR